MTSLNLLDLSQNRLTGPLKFQNISSSQFNYIDLSSNSLTGTIPSSLFTMTSLTDLDLSQNQLTGPLKFQNISSTLPQFTRLKLSSCNLREFPIFLKVQNELTDLDLSDNKIEGKVPRWFLNVGKETLQSLNISFNLLSGFEQPPIILPWKSLYYLDLRSNMFEGLLPIPPLSTIYFFASNNNLTGRIPPMICMLKALQVLDLSNKKLIGQIPHCLGNFSSSLSRTGNWISSWTCCHLKEAGLVYKNFWSEPTQVKMNAFSEFLTHMFKHMKLIANTGHLGISSTNNDPALHYTREILDLVLNPRPAEEGY
ncbi:receptor-like protein 47 [Quercus suber]|uniref:Receptor-like protein 47 n=1 Tax=Quercus suber TaxID=58331 RepID=A0AAW0JXY5_QUESU